MKKYKSYLCVALLAAFAATATSCNRGYGCPTDLSLAKVVTAAVQPGGLH